MATTNEAMQHLIKIMEGSGDLGLKVAAAKGLGFVGGSLARAHLIKMMEGSGKLELRVAAAEALGHATKVD